jgi:hypothetical protein
MTAASMVSNGGGFARGTAALAWALPVAQFPDRAELLRGRGSKTLLGCRVMRRSVVEGEVVSLNGVPVTSPERTAVDLALDLPVPEALITVDAVLRRGASRDQMMAIVDRIGRGPQAERARMTLEWADPRSESALESRGRGELMVRGAPRPLCNVTFRRGDVAFRLDHWWPGLALAGEADGALKYSSDKRGMRSLWQEKRRQEWFEDELGLVMFRYIDVEVRQTPEALYERFVRRATNAGSALWVPPEGLQIIKEPLPGLGGVPQRLGQSGEPL